MQLGRLAREAPAALAAFSPTAAGSDAHRCALWQIGAGSKKAQLGPSAAYAAKNEYLATCSTPVVANYINDRGVRAGRKPQVFTLPAQTPAARFPASRRCEGNRNLQTACRRRSLGQRRRAILPWLQLHSRRNNSSRFRTPSGICRL